MSATQKIRVAVLYGGRSAEHEVSIQSASNVIQFLDRSLFEVIPIGIDKNGAWFLGDDIFAHSLEHKAVAAIDHDCGTWFKPEWLNRTTALQTQNLPQRSTLNQPFDVVFPVVHGSLCEDGTLQGLLELADVAYVGCNVLASAVGMDKDVSKRLAQQSGINVPPFFAVTQGQWQKNPAHYLALADKMLTFPVFVKPANTGSSIGVEKVKTKEALANAIENAFAFDTKVLVEQGINARELEIAVLEALEPGQEPLVSVVGEIRPTHEFYTYEAKYIDKHGAELLLPAPLSPEISEKARTLARDIFSILGCEGLTRVDLFLDKDSGEVYFNEINTLPGFTEISMYPKLMAASGMEYSALLTHLVKLAIKRQQIKKNLIRSYSG